MYPSTNILAMERQLDDLVAKRAPRRRRGHRVADKENAPRGRRPSPPPPSMAQQSFQSFVAPRASPLRSTTMTHPSFASFAAPLTSPPPPPGLAAAPPRSSANADGLFPAPPTGDGFPDFPAPLLDLPAAPPSTCGDDASRRFDDGAASRPLAASRPPSLAASAAGDVFGASAAGDAFDDAGTWRTRGDPADLSGRAADGDLERPPDLPGRPADAPPDGDLERPADLPGDIGRPARYIAPYVPGDLDQPADDLPGDLDRPPLFAVDGRFLDARSPSAPELRGPRNRSLRPCPSAPGLGQKKRPARPRPASAAVVRGGAETKTSRRLREARGAGAFLNILLKHRQGGSRPRRGVLRGYSEGGSRAIRRSG